MIFANTKLRLTKDIEIPPGHKIPEEYLKKGGREELLARGMATEVSPAALAKLAAKGSKAASDVATAKWDFDPAALEKLSLDDLNMMIVNFVQKNQFAEVEPFEDKKEAIHWMSKDRVVEDKKPKK